MLCYSRWMIAVLCATTGFSRYIDRELKIFKPNIWLTWLNGNLRRKRGGESAMSTGCSSWVYAALDCGHARKVEDVPLLGALNNGS